VGFLHVGLEDEALAQDPAAGVHRRMEALGEFVLAVMRVAVGVQVEVALRLPPMCVIWHPFANGMEVCSAALAPRPPAADLLQMLHTDLWSAMMRAANARNGGGERRS
jgi:hypothetical protein